MQPWCTPFPIKKQSVVPWPVVNVASSHAYRFLRRQVRWYGVPITWRIFQFAVIHTVKGFGIVNKAVVDIFLDLPCFFDDPMDVGNLISGSSAFSKTSLNIWKFKVRVLLKPGLQNFEHYFASMWKWKLKSLICVWLFVNPWNSPGLNTGVGSLSLLQGIFQTQESNPGFPNDRWILYQLSHKGSLLACEMSAIMQ